PAQVLEVPLGHVPGRLRDALHLDRVRGLLGGLLNLAGHVHARLRLERLARGIPVENLLPLRVERRLLPGVVLPNLALFPVRPTAHRPLGPAAAVRRSVAVLALLAVTVAVPVARLAH